MYTYPSQSVHWQALPSQLVLTDNNSDNKSDIVEGIRSAPSIVSQLPRVKIESTDGFWKTKKNYVINDRSSQFLFFFFLTISDNLIKFS